MVKMTERPTGLKYKDHDSAEHGQRDCEELKEALQRDFVYYKGGGIHSMDSEKLLRPNFRNGGKKKVLEEATTP